MADETPMTPADEALNLLTASVNKKCWTPREGYLDEGSTAIRDAQAGTAYALLALVEEMREARKEQQAQFITLRRDLAQLIGGVYALAKAADATVQQSAITAEKLVETWTDGLAKVADTFDEGIEDINAHLSDVAEATDRTGSAIDAVCAAVDDAASKGSWWARLRRRPIGEGE